MNRLFAIKSLVTEALTSPLTPKVGSTWRHYKGDMYRVSGIGISEDTNKLQVCYFADRDPLPYPWIRSLDIWHESVGHEGKIVPRFEQI